MARPLRVSFPGAIYHVAKAEGRVEAQPKLMRRAKRVDRKVKMKKLGNA